MNKPENREGRRWFCTNIAAIVISSLLFAAAFPNLLVERGIFLCGWLAYIPLFWVVRRSSPVWCVFWGALYGFISYSIFNYWLTAFHPLAGLVVDVLVMLYCAIFYPLACFALKLFPKRGYLVQWICMVAFQYVHCQGFLGYSYGIIGYSQWQVLPLIQIASITGVWGVSALILFPQIYLAAALGDWRPGVSSAWGEIKRFFLRERAAACGWVVLFVAALVYGFLSPVDYSGAPEANIALIQHNTDPWRGAIDDYRNNLRTLERLSREALAAEPKPDLVVWSETAFVPRIYWHTTYRDDPDSYILIRELMDFLKEQDVPFVLGNDDARLEVGETGDYERVDYNAVFLYERDTLAQWYRKMHLVPFTEYFPYKKQFPWLYEILINADTHFWEKGKEATVFESSGGLKFSTPICFEDIFGYLSRNFVRDGAELIVNLSNDAWSKSLPAQNQHLSMAVFRAVENRRSMVRSTASGQTCGVDPNGKILAMARPFTEAWLTVSMPIVRNGTFYTKYGDYLPQICLAVALLLLLGGAARYIMKKVYKRKAP